MSAEVLTLRDEQGGLTLDHFRYEDERSEIVPRISVLSKPGRSM